MEPGSFQSDNSNDAERTKQREIFALQCIDELKRQNVAGPFEYDPEEFCITSGGGKAVSYLVNIEAEYRQSPELLSQILSNFVQSLREMQQKDTGDFDEIREMLVPVVRERVYLEFTKLAALVRQTETPTVPYRPITNSLIVSLAIDTPKSLRFVTTKDLETWSMSYDELYEIAIQNLDARTPGEWYEIKSDDGTHAIYLGDWQDCNSPARMLLPELVQRLPVKGQPVALIPNRNYLIITGSQDIDGQRSALGLLRQALEEPRPLSPRLLEWRDNRWQTFFPQYDTPLFDDYQQLYIESAAADYGEQKQLLEKIYETEGRDVFVATFGVLKNTETGALTSWCTWSEGVDTLLPVTDLIMFNSPKLGKAGGITAVKWADAVSTFGNLMTREEDLYPERWHVEDFPSIKQLKTIRVELGG